MTCSPTLIWKHHNNNMLMIHFESYKVYQTGCRNLIWPFQIESHECKLTRKKKPEKECEYGLKASKMGWKQIKVQEFELHESRNSCKSRETCIPGAFLIKSKALQTWSSKYHTHSPLHGSHYPTLEMWTPQWVWWYKSDFLMYIWEGQWQKFKHLMLG